MSQFWTWEFCPQCGGLSYDGQPNPCKCTPKYKPNPQRLYPEDPDYEAQKKKEAEEARQLDEAGGSPHLWVAGIFTNKHRS